MLLKNQIVNCCNRVVPVAHNILLGCLLIECLALLSNFVIVYLGNDFHIDGNGVLTDIDAMVLPYFCQLVPWVSSNTLNCKSVFGVVAENLFYQVLT